MGLLFHTKVRWLSRGKCLSQFYELKNKADFFLRKNKNNLYAHFLREEFVVLLAYLADVFGHLNDINLSLQDRDVTVSHVRNKLARLTTRIEVWQSRIKVEPITLFPLLKRRLKMNRIDLPAYM